MNADDAAAPFVRLRQLLESELAPHGIRVRHFAPLIPNDNRETKHIHVVFDLAENAGEVPDLNLTGFDFDALEREMRDDKDADRTSQTIAEIADNLDGGIL